MAESAPPPLTALEVAVAEANAVALGVSLDALMENAGRAVAEEAARHLPPPPARVAVLVGLGNNGGDASCAAFYLKQWGYTPELWLAGPAAGIRSGPARRCFERVSGRLPVHPRLPDVGELAGAELVLDGMLGSGQRGPLRPPFADGVRAVHDAGRPTLAIDVPTGYGSPEGLRARWTVALSAPKAGVPPEESGEVTVRSIGVPEAAFAQTGPGEFLFFRVPDQDPRGRSARVLIVGGGPYAGAPALAGLAALRAGAERATIAAPTPAASLIQGFSPNLVVVPLSSEVLRPDDVRSILALVDRGSVRSVVIGMGLGTDARTLEAAAELIRQLRGRIPLCVDADALAAVAGSGEAGSDSSRLVLTPNAGEFARHLASAGGAGGSTAADAAGLARKLGATLLVKGAPDVISDGTRTTLNTHHHPAMTVGGVGDVLAGVTGALLGQGVPAPFAARLAAYWVGDAGQRAAGERGFGLVATDVVEALPEALVDGLRRVRPAT